MDIYGLLGYPLSHSFSRDFFNQKFRDESIDAEYVNFEIPSIDYFPEILSSNENLHGLNVTIPYKEKIISYMDSLSEEAAHIGAVNVVRIDRIKGKTILKGFNSDVIGFTRSIKPKLTPERSHALVMGTGGASKAVCYGLKLLGLQVCHVSRTPRQGMISYAALTADVISRFKVIVNCTPLGMYPNTEECPDIPYQYLTPAHLLYDLVYNPDTTQFLQRGRDQGADTKNGLEMLLLQAEAGWKLWHTND